MPDMCIMDESGDTKVIWDPDNADEVDAARATFDRLRGKGYTAFSVEGKEGKQGKVVNKFDPKMERLILVPRMEGG